MPTPDQINASSVDPTLASSALAKISQGQGMDTLSQAEKAAIGKLSPAVVAQARAKITAPKPNAIPGAYPAGEAKGAKAMANAGLVPVTPPVAPKVGSREWTLAQGNGPNNVASEDTSAATSASAEGPLPVNPMGGVNLSALNMRASPVKSAPSLAEAIPVPPPAIVASNKPATVNSVSAPAPPASQPMTGYDMAKANEVPVGSMPVIPKGMDKAKLANIIGMVMDAVGGGMRAYGGVDAPTRLMQQGKINMQVEAERQAAQNAADIEYEQKIKLLPVEAQNAIKQARAIGDIKSEQDIATQYGIEKATEGIKTREIMAGKRPAIGSMGMAGAQAMGE